MKNVLHLLRRFLHSLPPSRAELARRRVTLLWEKHHRETKEEPAK